MAYEQLKLENQICFPVYAASRLITREYQPYLEELGLTYPQYLVLLVLWEQDELTVNDIAKKLILNTNTLTPLLKRMEAQGLLTRARSRQDERKVIVCLTEAGQEMQAKAAGIPERLVTGLSGGPMTSADVIQLKQQLDSLVAYLAAKEDQPPE
jgi:DNA-binding MarR family transcriptional regulator